ncbi:transmembrane protein, putative (macronuclear) [Tetrahymena thermophila SB210]|uniref:Transmembrane protein, putative n=1 Tax=Tetrahymena thermophila (strain SB210) TaxID=312017 RepID=W7XH24_TETTS|nr:transmembrane protein, putative [Tetrahymena thermophila SB210]EWS72304.1 transmembrane protein, putative [Tetrahymena thermophila SB210]|eukprot:XP_012655164.1 transmembrane protein, putative [Tetrahymena thermophila SB210]
MPSQFSTFLMAVLSPIQYIIQIFQPYIYKFIQDHNLLSLIYFNYLLKISVYAFILLILIVYGLVQYRKIHMLQKYFFYNTFYFIYLAFQPTIIRDSLNLIMCRKIDNENYVQENLLYKCFTDDYTKFTYKLLMPVLFAFAFILPLILCIFTKRNLNKDQKSKINYFMTYQYKQSFWFWEWVKLILRSIFLMTEQFLQDDYINSSLVIILLLCCYGYFFKKTLPNQYGLHNQIEFLFLIGTVLCIYVSLFLKLNEENQTITKICLSIIFSDFFSLTLIITYLIIQDSKQNLPTYFLYLKIWVYKYLCLNNLIFSKQQRKALKLKIFFLSYLSYMRKSGYLSNWTAKSNIKLRACILGSDLELQIITQDHKLLKQNKFSKRSNTIQMANLEKNQ